MRTSQLIKKFCLIESKILQELSTTWMLQRTTPDRQKKGRQIQGTVNLVSVRPGTIVYSTSDYTQKIKLPIYYGISKNQFKRELQGDAKVWCSCPDFNFGGAAYILTKRDGIIPGRENTQKPTVRNPDEIGALCKHLYSAIKQMRGKDSTRIYDLLHRH